MHRLRPIRGYEPRLMIAVLHRWAHRRLFVNHVNQTSIAHLPNEKFVAVPIPSPAPDEYRAIATVLSGMEDAELSALESAVIMNRAIKQGMTQEPLTGMTRLV